MTRLHLHGERTDLGSYNDLRHLDVAPEAGSTLVALVRHAESAANVRGAWDGRSDGPLTADGRAQAAALAARLAAPDAVYASPAQRAWRTAQALAAAHDAPLVADDRLVEMHFGAWEGRTSNEIALADPEGWEAVFEHGRDLPRGSSGETFAGVTARGRGALADIVARHPHGRVAAVGHGVLIRAVVSDVLGVGWPRARSLATLDNAGVAHLRFADDGPVLVDYGV